MLIIDILRQDVYEPEPDPPGQGPTPSTTATPTPTTKVEPEKSQHLPPSGSVDNPMEVDDSDEDEMTVQSPTVTPKRKKIGVCIADNPLAPLSRRF